MMHMLQYMLACTLGILDRGMLVMDAQSGCKVKAVF